jgi:hypothetical protein
MIPRTLYLCKQKDDTGFENVYIDKFVESKDTTIDDSISMLDDRCEHRLFGYYYYFSAKPIDPTYKDVNKLVRYAGFPEHCLYIVRDIGQVKRAVSLEKDEDADEDQDQDKDQDQDEDQDEVLESAENNKKTELLEKKVGGEEPNEKEVEKSKDGEQAKKLVDEPAKNSVDEPAKKLVDEPAKNPVENPAKNPVENPAKNPVENTAKNPVDEPLEEEEDESDETIAQSIYFQENGIPYYLFKKTTLFTRLS